MTGNSPTTEPTPTDTGDRRPLKTRQARWAQTLAAWLARRGVAPNAISVASVVFALLAAAALIGAEWIESWPLRAALLAAAAGGIQLRLLCNLLDGMVAVEGGRRSTTGDLYNEVPDRIADVLILAGAGYAVAAAQWRGQALVLPHPAALGWLASVLALMTAYVRALGRSLGTPSFFCGPMAKPHRMATVTLAAGVGAVVSPWGFEPWAIYASLVIIVLGAAVTCVRRLRLIAAALNHRPHDRREPGAPG